MTKTRSQMKGKSLVADISSSPSPAIAKKTPTKKTNSQSTAKKHLSYVKMIRETIANLSSTSTTSSKAVSTQAITRYLVSHFGVQAVDQTELDKCLREGVEEGTFRKVKRSFLLTSSSSSSSSSSTSSSPSSSSSSSSPSPSSSPAFKSRAPRTQKAQSKSSRAGLQFPVGRIESQLRSGRYASRISSDAPVYLAAVLEYMAAEIMELAGNCAQDFKKARITPREIQLAVRNDEELNTLLGSVTIPCGGTLPSIPAQLLPRRSGSLTYSYSPPSSSHSSTTYPTPSPSPSSSSSAPVPLRPPTSTAHHGFPCLGEEVPVDGPTGSTITPSSAEGGNGLELTLDLEKNKLAFDKEAVLTGIASVEAKKGGALGRPPCDIVAVVDRSGSMRGAELTLVKEALCYLVSQLGSEDRLCVVSFDHQAYDVFGLRLCSEEGKETMTNYINNHPKMQAGGTTNIRLGLEMGMSFLKQRKASNPVSAVMLLTDGYSNNGGGVDNASLKRWQDEVGGVPIHCFGFGDHDARMLANISDVAHGSFTFVENINTVGGAFATCLGGVLSVTAKQVVLRLETEVDWATFHQVHTTFPVSISRDGRKAEVTIPDTISEEKKDIVLSMKVGACPTALDDQKALFSCRGTFLNVRSETGRGTTETIEKVVCRIARPANDSNAVHSMRVDQEKNRIEVAEALKEAVRLGESNNLFGAQQCLDAALARLEGSLSGKDMGHLKDDLLSARGRFQTRGTYEKEGYAFARQQEQSHQRQRAVGGAGGEGYCNREQIAQRAANASFRS